MRYLGGKAKIAKHIATHIDAVREPGQWVWDAFCGGLSVSVALSVKGPVLATDANAALIALYEAVRNGWDPPGVVSRDRYEAAKSLPDSNPLKAFCGFGCSFAGKWFSGYASSGTRNYAANARNTLKGPGLIAEIAVEDFMAVRPGDDRPEIIYCDPPYRGTTGYAGVPAFDHDLFTSRVLSWAQHADVFVSEYAFPHGRVVWEREQITTTSRDKGAYKKAVERLYHIPRQH